MLRDSFSEQPDLPTSLPCFILFTGYLLSRGSNINCFCFALESFLIRLPSTFQNFFTFTLLPGSSALLQTNHTWVFRIPFFKNKVPWSALFLLLGSIYLEPAPCFCHSTSRFFHIFFKNPFFSPIAPINDCVCVLMLHALNFDNYVRLKNV